MGELSVINKLSEITIDELGKICEEEGVTVRGVCRVLKDGLEAVTAGRLDTEGEIIKGTQFKDMATRHKYMQSAMEMLRLVKKETKEIAEAVVTHRMAPEDIDRLEVIARELKGLEARLVTDKVQQGRVIDVASG